MVKRLHWTDMGMCLDVAPDNRPLYVTASDYDALARDLAACKIARDGFTAASDTGR